MEERRHELYDRLAPFLMDGRESVGDLRWFDAHTHIGHNDPDGYAAGPQDILDGLDEARQERALLFAMQEPGGYPPANDAVLAACADSGGRLQALCRVDPNAPGAMDEVRRCLAAGARGIKLHPRSDAFGLPHDVVGEIAALAGERRAPVLFHAGRGIPNLGAAAADLARENPGARIILAHCGISDLGLLGPVAAELPNLLFDTAWWQVSDTLALYASVPPARILYASDMPYGTGLFAGFMLLRCARAVGLGPEAIRGIAGGQLERVVGGEDLLDLGPAPGHAALGPRIIGLERVIAYAGAAVQLSFRGGDAAEALALARLACQTPDPDAEHAALLAVVDELLALAQETLTETPELPMRMVPAALAAQVIAGTPEAGVPGCPV
ncbi:MAG: uncharacterized protein QOF57_837 [Frankiaceae bacterium]|nr:uncharacterized protein [Frankiaceae bacterium]